MMQRALDLQSEPFGSTGNIGENFRRLLGAPTLDPLQTVIREAVQNIADAAKIGHGPEVLIRIRTLSPEQRRVLAETVLKDVPKEPHSRELLQTAKAKETLSVLEICDFRTTGLGGPTRADRIPVGTRRTDFIDFLRNIGAPRDTSHGGGTYGFGKVALYRASRCSTIVVDSLPADGGTDGRRLIGCHVGPSFDIPEDGMLRRFTGRHWWGAADPADRIVDPITGSRASELADALGFPARDAMRTGTSIMILDFDQEDNDLQLAGSRIAEILLWNFWPRMMQDVPESRRFSCRIEVEGKDLAIPMPEEIAPFDLFCKAMRSVRSKSGSDVRRIECERPARLLGILAMERGLASVRRPLVSEQSLVPPRLHHVALMRPVQLVVRYLEGTPLPSEVMEWAGVFICSDEDEVERAFANSEPPAHDDWIPNNLPKGNSKRFVRTALKKVRGIAMEIGYVPLGNAPGSESGPPLARLAGRLGAMLEGSIGDGAGEPRPSGRRAGAARPRRACASRPAFQRLEQGETGRIAVFATEVTQDAQRQGVLLSASVSIALDGAAVDLVDTDITKPVILSIDSPDGSRSIEGAPLPIEGKDGRYEIRVLVPEDCAVTVEANVLAAEAA